MCDKFSDQQYFLARNEKFGSSKYHFVILVLFSITCSSLGLSCYALYKVQIISEDLNVLKSTFRQSEIKSFENVMMKYNDRHNWADSMEDLTDESLNLKRIMEDSTEFLDRSKRSVPENAGTTIQTDELDISTTVGVKNEVINDSIKIESNERKTLHHIKKKAVIYDEDPETEAFTPNYPRNVYRQSHRRRNNQLEIIDEFSPQAGRLKSLIAIHFDGDTSKYVYGHHTNFNGNGHLRHPKKTFVDWKERDWVESIGAGNNFAINDGIVTVKDSGLYFVYAQIYYLDDHDMNGYRVYKNSDMLLQCTKTSHSIEKITKGNTCYTASAAYLDSNDNISVSDIAEGRYSLFEPGKSFFGLIKLGDVKIK